MDGNKQFVTQLSRADLQEIAAATNPVAGFAIRIEKTQGQLKIGIDENAFKLAIAAYLKNGGMGLTDPAAICNVPLTL